MEIEAISLDGNSIYLPVGPSAPCRLSQVRAEGDDADNDGSQGDHEHGRGG
jgi:hypothetical protein